jgi:hypothetical protein
VRKQQDEFRVREGSNRAKLLYVFLATIGKQTPILELMDSAYGKNKGSAKALSNDVGFLEKVIRDRKLPYEFVKHKKKQGMTIGLYPVEDKSSKVITTGATIASINPKGRLTGDDC